MLSSLAVFLTTQSLLPQPLSCSVKISSLLGPNSAGFKIVLDSVPYLKLDHGSISRTEHLPRRICLYEFPPMHFSYNWPHLLNLRCMVLFEMWDEEVLTGTGWWEVKIVLWEPGDTLEVGCIWYSSSLFKHSSVPNCIWRSMSRFGCPAHCSLTDHGLREVSRDLFFASFPPIPAQKASNKAKFGWVCTEMTEYVNCAYAAASLRARAPKHRRTWGCTNMRLPKLLNAGKTASPPPLGLFLGNKFN